MVNAPPVKFASSASVIARMSLTLPWLFVLKMDEVAVPVEKVPMPWLDVK